MVEFPIPENGQYPDKGHCQGKIIVVDDDPGVVRFLTKILNREGYSVDSAVNGAEALSLARGNDYSLVISDIVMPQMTGITFFERLKEVKPGTPIILISGHQEFDHALKALNLGAMAFLVKPFGAGELLKWVQRVGDLQKVHTVHHLLFENMIANSYEVALTTGVLMERDNIQVMAHCLATQYGKGRVLDRITRMKVELAILEALRNSLEHGNIELPSALKENDCGLSGDDPYHKLMLERLADPGFADKRIYLKYSRSGGRTVITIRDEGKGFNHRLMGNTFHDTEQVHGRGMLLIRSGVDEVSYNDAGNEINLVWN